MMIRYFAQVDETSELSRFALSYCNALVEVGDAEEAPVRLVPTEMVSDLIGERGEHLSRWAKHIDRFITPIEPQFVNVVCTSTYWWSKLWTRGARNVLIMPFQERLAPPPAALLPYDIVIVPSKDHRDEFSRVLGDDHGVNVVAFGPGSPLSILRDALFGHATPTAVISDPG